MRPIENVEQVPPNANSVAAAIQRLQLIKNALKRFVGPGLPFPPEEMGVVWLLKGLNIVNQ